MSDEINKILAKIRILLEDEEGLSLESCYFLTKKLNEDYWQIIDEEDLNISESDEELDDEELDDEELDDEELDDEKLEKMEIKEKSIPENLINEKKQIKKEKISGGEKK
jgi:hypothetical protein